MKKNTPAAPSTFTTPAEQPKAMKWFFIVVLVAAFVRFIPVKVNLDDELFTWWTSQKSVSELIHICSGDVHPPMYFLIAKVWGSLFGNDLNSLRAFSGVTGLLTIVFLWFFVSHVLRREGESAATVRTAMIATGLVAALSMPAIASSHWARMYSLMSFVGVLSVWGLYFGAKRPRCWPAWLLFTATSIVLVLTHNYGGFFLVGQIVWVSLETWKRGSGERRRVLTPLSISCVIIAAGAAIWLPVVLRQTREVSNGYWIQDLSWHSCGSAVISFFFPVANYSLRIIEAFFVVVFALFVLVPFRNGFFERFVLVQVVVHVLAIVFFQVVLDRSIFVPRYLICLLPFIIAALCIRIAKIGRSWARNLAFGLLALNMGTAISFGMAAQRTSFARIENDPVFREFAKKLDSETDDGNVVVICNAPFPYLQICFFAPEDIDLWFWNPSLVEASQRRHVEFLSCVPSGRILTKERIDDLGIERILLYESETANPPEIPANWKEIEGLGDDMFARNVRQFVVHELSPVRPSGI